MKSVSTGYIILSPTQPVGSGRPQRESNPGPPHQESHALPTEPPRPHGTRHYYLPAAPMHDSPGAIISIYRNLRLRKAKQQDGKVSRAQRRGQNTKNKTNHNKKSIKMKESKIRLRNELKDIA